MNEQWSTYTGRSLEDVMSLGWREFVHPQDIEEKSRIWKTALERESDFEFEHRFRRADGQYRWHLSRAQPMRDSAGRTVMWIGTNMDVHDLKQAQLELEESESRSRLAIEAAGMGYWDWDIGKHVRWSPEHNRIMGMDPTVTEGSYQLFLERVHPEDRVHVVKQVEHSEQTGEDFQAEFRVVLADGSIRWVAGHGRPFFTPGRRKASRMLGVVRDVTERNDFEDQLRRNQLDLEAALKSAESARDEAEAAGRAKDQFLAVLSHELRTPLTPVLMATSTLLHEPGLDDDMKEALHMIKRNVQLEARLINDLLDLTRITRGTLELRIASMDLHAAIQQAVEICRTEVTASGLTLTVNLDATEHTVMADFARLQQVFWNLIMNAIKFTPAQGSIEVRTSSVNGTILVEVEDNGMGIAPEILPRIFKPFEQGAQDFARDFGGLGLGLAISKATLDAHGGELSAQSPGPGKGTVITVKLAHT